MAPSPYVVVSPADKPASDDWIPPRPRYATQPTLPTAARLDLPQQRRRTGRKNVYGASDPLLIESKRYLLAKRSAPAPEWVGAVDGARPQLAVAALHKRASLEPNDTQKVTLGVS